MWLMIALMAAFIILDKTRLMKVNTLFMSVLYMVSIPLLICGYAWAVVDALVKISEKATAMRLIGLGASLLLAVPAVILLVVTLYKICRTPIDPDRWDGRDDYETACIKRQRTLLWVAYPLTWVCVAAAAAIGAYYLLILVGLSLVMMHPFFLFLCLCTLGLILPIYGIFVLCVTSPLLGAFAIFGFAAFMFLVVNISLTSTMLWRMRGRLGWSKPKYILKVISMLIPIWSLVTLIELSRRVKV